MAEITSYPTANPKSGDYLLGAQVGAPGDPAATPTKKFTVDSILALGTTPLVQRVQRVITSAELLSFNTYPTSIELLPNPGPNKVIVALNATFKMNYEPGPNTPYNFNQDLKLVYTSPTGTTFAGDIPFELLNATVNNDTYATEDLPGQPGSPLNLIKVDSSFGIANNGGTTVTGGTGELVIDLLYRIVEFPS